MTSREVTEWMAYFDLEHREREEAKDRLAREREASAAMAMRAELKASGNRSFAGARRRR